MPLTAEVHITSQHKYTHCLINNYKVDFRPQWRSWTASNHSTSEHLYKPYKCSLCNKSFSLSGHLQSHKRHIHSNRRPHQCPYCGQQFKTNTHLKFHVRTHTGAKPYSCRHCSISFAWPGLLKEHLLKSHNEGTWLICNICQKRFSRSGQLNGHLRRHQSVKPYFCSFCSWRFYTAAELKDHQLVHTDFKQFCCGLCGKWYKRKRCVKRHFKSCSDKLGFSDILSAELMTGIGKQTVACQ